MQQAAVAQAAMKPIKPANVEMSNGPILQDRQEAMDPNQGGKMEKEINLERGERTGHLGLIS